MGADQHGEAYPEPTPYRCPICRGNENRYMGCNHPGCLDGRDHNHPHAKAWARKQPEVRRRFTPVRWTIWVIEVMLIITLAAFLAGFKGYDPDTSPNAKWFESLPRPDMPPGYPCCGKADAYPVDRYWPNGDGSYTAVIADGSAKVYPDGTERPYVAAGTEVLVPAMKVNTEAFDLDNPTEYSWVFMRVLAGNVQQVYCFIRHPQGN